MAASSGYTLKLIITIYYIVPLIWHILQHGPCINRIYNLELHSTTANVPSRPDASYHSSCQTAQPVFWSSVVCQRLALHELTSLSSRHTVSFFLDLLVLLDCLGHQQIYDAIWRQVLCSLNVPLFFDQSFSASGLAFFLDRGKTY